jgi:hypothetical protein
MVRLPPGGVSWINLPTVLTALAATAVATMAAATTTAEPTVFLRTRFVDLQISTVEFSSIQSSDCTLRFIVPAHLNESKASGLSRITVRDQVYSFNGSILFEQRSNVCFGCAEAKVSNKYIFHLRLSEFAELANCGRIGRGV